MATVENSNTILEAGIFPVDVARIRSHADHIALFPADSPQRRVTDGRAAHVGRIIERIRHRVQYLVLVVSRQDVRIFLRYLVARRALQKRHGKREQQAQPRYASDHRKFPNRETTSRQSSFSLRRRWPSVRKRNAFSF